MLLETKRLLIEKLTISMAYDLYINSLDEDNRRFVPDEVWESEEEARKTIEYLIQFYDKLDGPLVYPLILKETNQNIGYVQICPIEDGKWEIGYHIAKKHTGHGYSFEAVEGFLPYIMDILHIREVYGICLSDNKASCHILEKLGFTLVFEGIADYQYEKRTVTKYIYTK